MISIRVQSIILPVSELDKKEVKVGIRKAVNLVKRDAFKKLSVKTTSKAGEYPALKTGALRRALEIKWGRQGRPYARLQVGTIYAGKRKGGDAKFWYAGPLNYGRHDGKLKPRANPIADAREQHREKCIEIIQNAMIEAIK